MNYEDDIRDTQDVLLLLSIIECCINMYRSQLNTMAYRLIPKMHTHKKNKHNNHIVETIIF